jgi:hypothetical protein
MLETAWRLSEDKWEQISKALSGRELKILFQLKPGRIVRIITGWPL